MGTLTEVASILDSSPLASRLSDAEAHTLLMDLNEIGGYLSQLVEELRVIHEAMLQLATRVDEIAA